jgi:hypothetical protein
MRLYLLAAAIAFALPAAAQEKPAAPPKLFASDAEVQSLLAKLRAEHKPGSSDEIIVSVGPYPVELEYRTAATPPGLHKDKAELVYVVAGGCTLVTGGTLVWPCTETQQGRLRSGAVKHAALVLRCARRICDSDYAHADGGSVTRLARLAAESPTQCRLD